MQMSFCALCVTQKGAVVSLQKTNRLAKMKYLQLCGQSKNGLGA